MLVRRRRRSAAASRGRPRRTVDSASGHHQHRCAVPRFDSAPDTWDTPQPDWIRSPSRPQIRNRSTSSRRPSALSSRSLATPPSCWAVSSPVFVRPFIASRNSTAERHEALCSCSEALICSTASRTPSTLSRMRPALRGSAPRSSRAPAGRHRASPPSRATPPRCHGPAPPPPPLISSTPAAHPLHQLHHMGSRPGLFAHRRHDPADAGSRLAGRARDLFQALAGLGCEIDTAGHARRAALDRADRVGALFLYGADLRTDLLRARQHAVGEILDLVRNDR